MNAHLDRRSVTTKIASAIAAVAASCLTLGSIALLFGTATDHPAVSAVVAQLEPTRS